MTAIERDNPALKGVLPKDYARPALDKQRLAFIRAHTTGNSNGDRAKADISIYGQESNYNPVLERLGRKTHGWIPIVRRR